MQLSVLFVHVELSWSLWELMRMISRMIRLLEARVR